jgi:hypothetical protein
MKENNIANLMQTLGSQMNLSPSELLNFNNNKNIVTENDMNELQSDINTAKKSMFSKDKKSINFSGINFTEAQRQKYFNLRNLYKTWNKKRFLANRFIDYNRFVVNDGLINSMKVLNDGSLILCTEKGIILKYDKNVFNEEAVFKNYSGKKIYCVNQNKNNVIFFANEDNDIIFIEIVNEVNIKEIKCIKKAHENVINKIIELINENLISISLDGNIKIWENYNERKKIKLNKIYNDVIQINDNIICCLNSNEKKVDFIDFNSGKITNSINNINIDVEENVYDCNLMILLENNNLIVAGNEEFYIINTEKFNIINKIKIEKKITCILNAFNDCILIGDKGGNIVQYKNENNEYKKLSILKKAHFYFIKSLMFLKNGMIVSLSESTAKIWDY